MGGEEGERKWEGGGRREGDIMLYGNSSTATTKRKETVSSSALSYLFPSPCHPLVAHPSFTVSLAANLNRVGSVVDTAVRRVHDEPRPVLTGQCPVLESFIDSF